MYSGKKSLRKSRYIIADSSRITKNNPTFRGMGLIFGSFLQHFTTTIFSYVPFFNLIPTNLLIRFRRLIIHFGIPFFFFKQKSKCDRRRESWKRRCTEEQMIDIGKGRKNALKCLEGFIHTFAPTLPFDAHSAVPNAKTIYLFLFEIWRKFFRECSIFFLHMKMMIRIHRLVHKPYQLTSETFSLDL